MRFLTWLLTYAVALAVATWLLDDIYFTGPGNGTTELAEKLLPLIAVAVIFGAVTSFVKPVLKLLSIPFIIITLGLFLLLINAGMLLLTGWLADGLDLGFHVDGFWTAVGGAIVITLTTWLVDALVGEKKDR